MSGLIEQLQEEALDRSTQASDLLRRAKLVAGKLGLSSTVEWIDSELNGYEEVHVDDLPTYRLLYGQPRALDLRSGRYVPLVLTNHPELQTLISKKAIVASARELEHMLTQQGEVFYPYQPEMIKLICDSFRIGPTPMGVVVQMNSISSILDCIKTKILDWSISLEQAGVNGSGLSFTGEEKQIALSGQININIASGGQFNGVVGYNRGRVSVSNSGLDHKEVLNFIEELDLIKGHLRIGQDDFEELQRSIVEVREELSKKKPNDGKIKTILTSIKAISEGATGSLVASGVVEGLTRLIGGG